ncbi:ClpXP protease specificity-enhancing factor [Alteromonas sp. ASW11-130]|uniref:ClpXP protease specificity-enhancing factor n=1 Tax=Alteromonas sp. ASW11-130 TaxID=3015775 RepID=UPI0022429BC3|nr:ClpXP protease specificity-enhancing factor [Alteromonas sp. ASW11-130]MCW8090460.1 ClpXP protease specificity-enhancing factor [Alteromonas sp. ASW11-130]
MTSNQPYLLRAFFDWIVDNNLTPYIVVDATRQHVEVPQEFVKDGQIVLNVSPSACVNFSLDNELLAFQARFGGQPRRLSIPCHAILAIYARENGAGTVFASEEELSSPAEPEEKPQIQDAEEASVETQQKPPKKGKPTLKVIK